MSWFNGSNREVRTTPEKPTYNSKNNFTANQLKTDLVENYGSTTWYQNIKNVSVTGNTIEVKTNLTAKNEKAGKICGGVSFLVYSYDGTTHDEIIIVFDDKNNILIRRKGIAERCD